MELLQLKKRYPGPPFTLEVFNKIIEKYLEALETSEKYPGPPATPGVFQK